jgi:hypothetical protein
MRMKSIAIGAVASVIGKCLFLVRIDFMEVKEIPFTKENWRLGAVPAGCCKECGVKHEVGLPHNAQSLYYKYSFYLEHQRWPNWIDAMAHCNEGMKKHWREELMKRGVDVDGGKITPS